MSDKFKAGDRVKRVLRPGTVGTVAKTFLHSSGVRVIFDDEPGVENICYEGYLSLADDVSQKDVDLVVNPLTLISTVEYEKLQADLKAVQDEAAKLRTDLEQANAAAARMCEQNARLLDDIGRYESQRAFDQSIRETLARQRDRAITRIRRIREVLDGSVS